MSTMSKKVHFIKSINHKPLCGRGRNAAICSYYWKLVSCARCLRVQKHGSEIQKRNAKGNS